MENKFLKLISMLLVIGILFMPITAFADEDEDEDVLRDPAPGEMQIDLEAIYDGPELDQARIRAIGHEVAPFLFLEDMTRVEQQRRQADEAFIEMAREIVFTGESPSLRLDTSAIVDELFRDSEDRTGLHTTVRPQIAYFHVPPWLLVVGGIMLTGVLIYVAMILGEKLGHVIHKKKEEEGSG